MGQNGDELILDTSAFVDSYCNALIGGTRGPLFPAELSSSHDQTHLNKIKSLGSLESYRQASLIKTRAKLFPVDLESQS